MLREKTRDGWIPGSLVPSWDRIVNEYNILMCEIEGLTGIQKKSSGIPKILIPYPINNSEKDINA